MKKLVKILVFMFLFNPISCTYVYNDFCGSKAFKCCKLNGCATLRKRSTECSKVMSDALNCGDCGIDCAVIQCPPGLVHTDRCVDGSCCAGLPPPPPVYSF